jgi:intracellular sulfur oxidation DsrE/DsrF family protein
MKSQPKKGAIVFIMVLFMVFSCLSIVSAQEYEGFKGVSSAKVFFDMRIGNPQSAAIHLNLIHETYKSLMTMKKKPVFVVVFMSGAVKLISSNRMDFKSEDTKYLDEIAATVSKMSKEGIHFEVCLAAAKLLGVDPASLQSEFKQVGNGWISEAGYQARGYSLVPVY